jgi:cell division protein FtsB
MANVRASNRPTHVVRAVLSRAAVPAIAILAMSFFGYYAVLGPNGAFAYRDYTRQLEKRQAEFAMLDKARAELRNRVQRLDPKGADPDLVDELVRTKLNVAHPNEVIVSLR